MSARIKHSFEQDAYLWILKILVVMNNTLWVTINLYLPQRRWVYSYRSRYGKIPIPGDLRAWNLVTWPGSVLASDAFALTNRSSTAARTLTMAVPSANCSGVLSMVLFLLSCEIKQYDIIVENVAHMPQMGFLKYLRTCWSLPIQFSQRPRFNMVQKCLSKMSKLL